MIDEAPHPYTIDVVALTKPEGHFGWAIRRSGRLIERSDRPYTSAEKAQEKALEAIERDMKPNPQHGRR